MAHELVPSWQFKQGMVRGYIAGGGEHGVEITDIGDGLPGTRPMCLNVEHYYSRSCRNGRFVPRYKAKVASMCVGDAVVVTIDPHDAWQVQTEITFRVLRRLAIEARYRFRFLAPFAGFEAFVSNYFLDSTEPYIHVGGAWVQPSLAEGEHRYWAKGPDQADNIRAVYQRELTPADNIELPVDRDYYDYPIMVTPVRKTKWSIVSIVEPAYCSSLSANRRWNAHDFSLLARDVKEGQELSCRAWLACCELGSLDDAMQLCDELLKG